MRKGKNQVQRALWAAVAVFLAATISPVGTWAEESGNMVVFKGGFMRLNSDRGNEIFTDTQSGTTGPVLGGNRPLNDGQVGWYAGAWLDLGLSKDAWGLMQGITGIGEIGLQFNRIASKTVTSAVPTTTALAGTPLGGGTTPANTQLTMVTINVSPKLKFMEGSAFRPWIIPIGLDIHVISPPSNQTQYLDVGVQFGAGFEYALWKAFKVGMDTRYHLAANMTNTSNSYFQVGPYVGITF